MKARNGLYVALIGLVLTVLCGAAALLIADWGNGPNGWENINMTGVVLVYVGLFIGFILMLVGLAVAGAVMKPS